MKNVLIFFIVFLLGCNPNKNITHHKEFSPGIYSATKLSLKERFVFSRKFDSNFSEFFIIAIKFSEDSTFKLFGCNGTVFSTGNWKLNDQKDSIALFNWIENSNKKFPDQNLYFRNGYIYFPFPYDDSLKHGYSTYTTVLKQGGEFFDTVTMKADNK